MRPPATIETMTAAVDTVVPAVDGAASASELGAHELAMDLLDKALPSGADLVAGLLDAYAAQIQDETRFAMLAAEERARVFDALASSGIGDFRDAVDAIIVFTLSAVYSEWSASDDGAGVAPRPASWDAVGYHGPVAGVPAYRNDR